MPAARLILTIFSQIAGSCVSQFLGERRQLALEPGASAGISRGAPRRMLCGSS